MPEYHDQIEREFQQKWKDDNEEENMKSLEQIAQKTAESLCRHHKIIGRYTLFHETVLTALQSLTQQHAQELDAQEVVHEAQVVSLTKERDDAREDVKRLNWRPIETLDTTKMDFVLVCGDGAVRLLLWNPRGHWEAAPPHFGPIQPDVELTHWMPCPDAINQAMTGGAE